MKAAKKPLPGEFGATYFIDNSKEDPVPKIQELTNGGVDFVFEATGDVGAIKQVYWTMGVGGKQIQIGIHDYRETIPMTLSFTPPHNRDIIGTLSRSQDAGFANSINPHKNTAILTEWRSSQQSWG